MRISDWSSDVCSSDLSTPEPSTDSEPYATSLAPTTDEIRDDEAERALDETPVPVLSAPSQTPPPRATSKPKGGKPRIERPTIELEGKRAMVVEALLHFDGEEEPGIVSTEESRVGKEGGGTCSTGGSAYN